MMSKTDLRSIGGLLLDYLSILSQELVDTSSKTHKEYLKEKIITVKDLIGKIGVLLKNDKKTN